MELLPVAPMPARQQRRPPPAAAMPPPPRQAGHAEAGGRVRLPAFLQPLARRMSP